MRTRALRVKDACYHCIVALYMVIGFLNERYSVGESAGTLSIRFGVIKRRLVTDISVQLGFLDGSALAPRIVQQNC